METKDYTITVFSEHRTGILSRVVSIFTRRHVNVESLTTSQSSIEGIHRFTIVVLVTEDMVQKLVAQLDKQVDILKAFYYDSAEIVYQEIALYKVPFSMFSDGTSVERMLRTHNARILVIEPEYVVIEKSGHERETEALLQELKALGDLYGFVRSGRVAIVKPMERLNRYLESIEKENTVEETS
ncbi:MAG: acetolactate synthase small subunit [Bacteroidetes bacterium]|nr:MAG: acetolactate synthase small subunit [Bacteroidota bacterium]